MQSSSRLCCRVTAVTVPYGLSGTPIYSSVSPHLSKSARHAAGSLSRTSAALRRGSSFFPCCSPVGRSSIRWISTEARQSSSPPAPPPPVWQDLARLITASAPPFRADKESDQGHIALTNLLNYNSTASYEVTVGYKSSALRSLWLKWYHVAFTQSSDEVAPPSSPRGGSGAPSPNALHFPSYASHDTDEAGKASSFTMEEWLSACLPGEAEEIPFFVQALGTLAVTLHAHLSEGGRTSPANSGPATSTNADALTLVEMCEWLSEVQAVLLYVGRHQLRFLIPPSFRAASLLARDASSIQPLATVMDETPLQNDAPAELPEREGVAINSVSETKHVFSVSEDRTTHLQPHKTQQPSLRLLSRSEQERLRHKAPPLPPDELLRVVVLVEAARTVLEAARPPPLASTVRSELYTVLLSVLGASEQLSSSALASLTTCLARCVDSYATRQRLPPLVMCGKGCLEDSAGMRTENVFREFVEDAEGDGECASSLESSLRCFYRPVSWSDTGDGLDVMPVVCASALEKAEEAQLAQHRGGLNLMLRPVEVLQQLAVLANVAQHRLARTLRAMEEEEEEEGLHHGTSDTSLPRADTSQALRAPSSRASTARLAQQERIAEGMLGLLSLQERKARQAGEGATMARRGKGVHDRLPNTPPRQRRTVAMIQADAQRQAEEKLQHSVGEARNDTEESVIHEAAAAVASRMDQREKNFATSSTMDNTIASALSVADITLTDVAEICGALAAMGYRGGGGSASSSEEPLWLLAADFACAEIDAVARARDAMVEEAGETEIVDASAAHYSPDADTADILRTRDELNVAVEQLLRDARDIVFALDRVGFHRGYDQVMARLVQRAFLSSPVPAPSASARVMRKCA